MKILHNHLGYACQSRKLALIQTSAAFNAKFFTIYDHDSRQPVLEGALHALGSVSNWRNWHYWQADFSELQVEGNFVLSVNAYTPALVSQPFKITRQLYDGQHISDLVHYFKSQRCSGIFDQADHSRPKLGSEQRVDVHGGWYDASGDASKYLSHLSYANFMNPQQTPQVVWNLVDGRARMPKQSAWLDERMVDEALHGADFLMRMLDPDDYFYMTVFDRWSKDVEQRDICSYTTQQGHKFATYQAAFRQGGGMAIAALARASALPRDGEYARNSYLEAAERAFAHLELHNLNYLDDGEENIIDDYCALLAAVELYAATRNPSYLAKAHSRAERLLARQDPAGWFWANDGRTRSYFHAVEAGLPCIALLRLMEVAPDTNHAKALLAGVKRTLEHTIALAKSESGNPFGYPRQVVALPGQALRTQFFIPHDNESGYWWQGENARLGSLAAAALMAQAWFADEAAFHASLQSFAETTLDWIFGYNPFDTCMMQAYGHNNPRYEAGYWNAPGGVCNGITSGLEDESDIDFRAPHDTVPTQSWRWTEQWLPHGAWLFHALAQLI